MNARKFAAFLFVLAAFAGVLLGAQKRASAGVLFDEDASASDAGIVDAANSDAGGDAAPTQTAAPSSPDASIVQVVVVAPSATPLPPPPPAQPPSPFTAYDPRAEYTGLAIGVRAGFSLPVGQAKSAALSDVVGSVVPVGIDVGYYLKPNLYIGAYFLYGFATTSTSSEDACPAGGDTTCSAQQYRFGVNIEYAFRHHAVVSPWIRYGIGLDVVNLESNDSEADDTSTVDDSEAASLFGLEWAILSAGLDFKPGYFYGLGPYVEAAFGDYFTSGGFAAPHAWFTFGLRLRTGLFLP